MKVFSNRLFICIIFVLALALFASGCGSDRQDEKPLPKASTSTQEKQTNDLEADPAPIPAPKEPNVDPAPKPPASSPEKKPVDMIARGSIPKSMIGDGPVFDDAGNSVPGTSVANGDLEKETTIAARKSENPDFQNGTVRCEGPDDLQIKIEAGKIVHCSLLKKGSAELHVVITFKDKAGNFTVKIRT